VTTRPILNQIAQSGGMAESVSFREDGTFVNFERRVIADAKGASLKTAVIGGLPPPCVDLGSLEDFLSRFNFPEIPPESGS
jgi:hypothetical protein